MDVIRDPEIMARARRTFDLYELAESMMRQNLRRRYPNESEEQIEERIGDWLKDRPGAPVGDASGPMFRAGRMPE